MSLLKWFRNLVRSYRQRSFLLVAEDEVINKPGFPSSWTRSGTYQIQYCSGEVALKILGSQNLQTRPRLPVIIRIGPFQSVVLLHISRELKYQTGAHILGSFGHAGAKMNSWMPALQNEAEMEKHVLGLRPSEPSLPTSPQRFPTLKSPSGTDSKEGFLTSCRC